MGTAAGVSVFLREDVNECFRMMLIEYQEFLASKASAAVLSTNPDGWFSPQALTVMGQVASQGYNNNLTFAQAFVCNPSAPAYGYATWDEFFTRDFRDGIRPVFSPGNASYIGNACESTPYQLSTQVQLQDTFWTKGQPYSLLDMIGNPDWANLFAQGTVYQAFLSALSYHKWHAPVTGTIVAIYNIPGSYYAESYWEGFANIGPDGQPNPDPAAPNDSQGYISNLATRAVMVIKADDPRIAEMACVMIGMAEVSSCAWKAGLVVGSRVNKGDPIGTVRTMHGSG
jgi:phosphatidylserine decarboxylase